jgi:hypothetical protein
MLKKIFSITIGPESVTVLEDRGMDETYFKVVSQGHKGTDEGISHSIDEIAKFTAAHLGLPTLMTTFKAFILVGSKTSWRES